MIAVIFEVEPLPNRSADYFAAAAALKPLLETIDGFVSVKRYESLTTPGRYLSLSFFRDEAAVAEWRQTMAHRQTQAAGRERIFADYRLRVAEVVRSYGLTDRDQAPADSRVAFPAP